MVSNKLLNRLKHAHHVTVLTGSDLSLESGIDMKKDWQGFSSEKLLTGETLNNDPGLFWNYINQKRKEISGVQPNLGHYSLVDFIRYYGQFDLITLNNDNLHQTAGNSNVTELNGNIFRTKCTKCSFSRIDGGSMESSSINCPECQSLLRPDIVLCDEKINKGVFNEANEASATCEVFFSIGVPYLTDQLSSLPFIAKGNGSYLVEINSGQTNLSEHADETISAKSGKILPLMAIVLEKIK